jgi:hypothetical protein
MTAIPGMPGKPRPQMLLRQIQETDAQLQRLHVRRNRLNAAIARRLRVAAKAKAKPKLTGNGRDI